MSAGETMATSRRPIRLRVNGWLVDWVPECRNLPARALELARRIEEGAGTVLHETPRSILRRLPSGEGADWVAKQPREKNTRLWHRLMTAVQPGEARRSLDHALRLRAQGFAVPEPVAAFEKRRLGLVVDSWFCYEYAPGTPCPENRYPAIIALLGRLHETGRVHGDPHINNFLADGGRVVMLDARTRPALWGAVSRAYDFVLLAKSCPAAARCPEFPSRSVAYRLASLYNRLVRGWRRLKKKIRKKTAAAPDPVA